ncbi:hypothetical protein GF324_14055 [bacterium]|nr:hypothetical protein [bacterium]
MHRLSNTPSKRGRLLVVGAAVLDRLFYVPELPRPGETAIGETMEVHPGGKGANQALAAALAGAEVRFLSSIGRDEAGELVTAPLRDAGIDTTGIHIDPEKHTAEAICAVSADGENQITACPGAYHSFSPELLCERERWFAWAEILLVQNELPRATVETAIELGIRHDLQILFNPAPFKKNMPPPARGLFALIPNAVEAAGLLGVERYEALSPGERRRKWDETGAEHVIVTIGEAGSEWFGPHKTHARFETPSVEAVDTVGAGDAFCGVLAALIGEGMEMRDAIPWAHRAAALAVTKKGAQSGLPSRAQLAAYQ